MVTKSQKTPGMGMSREGFRDILEASSDAIIIAGEDGRILFWNHASERLFGPHA